MSALRPWLELARISNLPTVWTNVLAGWLLAGGGWEWMALAWLLAGGSLMYTAGMILNDAMDVKFDREHRRERPIPSGRVSAQAAWVVGIGMLLAGGAVCVLVAGACLWLTLGLTAAILVYDAYHKPWAGSVLVMGACRTLLYLVAGSAVTGGLSFSGGEGRDGVASSFPLISRAVALGGYVVGLSLAARSETGAKKTMGAGVVLGLLGLAMPFLAWFPEVSQPHLALSRRFEILMLQFLPPVVLFWVVLRGLIMMKTPPPSNIGRAVGLLLAGIVVVDALAICVRAPFASLAFVLTMPLLMLWQRKIAAT